MNMPGGMEWILIVFVILLLFGARKLPDLARSLGKSISEFKKGKEEGQKSLEEGQKNSDDAQKKPGETSS